MGEVGLLPFDFLNMSWADWQRAAQGYIIRNARYLNGVRKISYFVMLAAGAKHLTQEKMFKLITDKEIEPPKINEADKITKEKHDMLLDFYFNNKKGKAWRQLKQG